MNVSSEEDRTRWESPAFGVGDVRDVVENSEVSE